MNSVVSVICCLWLLHGYVEGGSGYFYPKPKYILEITPSIELFSKSITYEESPVTQNYQQKHYQGHNYAQGYTTIRTPYAKNIYQGINYVHSPTKPISTKNYSTGHYNKGHYTPILQNTGHYSSTSVRQQNTGHYNPQQSSIQNTGHYIQGPLVQQSSIQNSQKTTNGFHYAPKSIHGNQLIMDMGDYKISLPISSDGIMADGEYLVKIPIYQKVTKK
ncbi:hypothetical protein ACFFRR_011768 [Megaselia abdita]